MKIAVLGESPAFPINMVDAFSLRHEARLFSGTPSDYRQQYAGTLLDTDANRLDARQFIENADVLAVSGVSSIRCLAMIAGSEWVQWLKDLQHLRELKFVLYIVDTPYWFDPNYWDGLLRTSLRPSTLFICPDMFPLTNIKTAKPLLYPHKVINGHKADIPSIIFSPGNKRKSETKGTAEIENTIRRLQGEGLNFTYRRMMGETYQDTLQAKAEAHIMIDRLPPPGQPDGLGNTGMEGMGAGMAVLSDMYDQTYTDPYFERPPIIDVKSPDDLYHELKKLILNPALCAETGKAGQEWIKNTFAFEPWLDYVERYL